jgi:hypothetical protein
MSATVRNVIDDVTCKSSIVYNEIYCPMKFITHIFNGTCFVVIALL